MASLPEFATDDGVNPTGKASTHNERDAILLREAGNEIVAELDKMAATAMQRRSSTEQRWLRNLRQFHGQYEKGTESALKADEGRSRTFINVTRTKTNAWVARIGDMLFPNDEKNFGVNPTPVPNLTQSAREAVQEAEALDEEAAGAIDQHNAALEAGQEPDPQLAAQAGQAGARAKQLRDTYDQSQKMLEEARKRAQGMERTIDDQLTEAKYPSQARLVIEDAAKMGPGIVKGPILGGKHKRTWKLLSGSDEKQVTPNESDENGNPAKTWNLERGETNAPMFRRVNPWHWFPDPDAETMEDAEYVLERHMPNKKMLRRMAREQGFDKETTRELLKQGPQHGQHSADGQQYLEILREMENGGEGTDGTSSPLADRFQVWEFYGTLEIDQIARMIRALGRHEDAERFEKESDELETHMVRVFFCDRKLLKIEENYLLDSQEFPYSVFSFEKAEASILGAVGVPELMEDEQSMLNSAVRMMMDNGALASGPQLVIDKEAVSPENGSWKMTPRKIWSWLRSKTTQGKEAPFLSIDIPMNQEQLSAIIMLALRFIDEAVAMPLIAQGEQGQHITKTSSGMSMLFNSANVVFRRVIKNWDDEITTPIIRRTFDFNMQFSDDESIKGDMQIEARGTSVLLVREMQAEQLLNIIDRYSTHPILGVALKAYEAMKLVLQAMNINPGDVLLERDDYLEKLQSMSEDDGGESADAIRAQTSLEVANIDASVKREQMASDRYIAEVRRDTEMLQLAQNREISLAQIEAMFKTKQFDGAVRLAQEKERGRAKERALAAEIATEKQNAREAREDGFQPTGSGGAVSFGVDDTP